MIKLKKAYVARNCPEGIFSIIEKKLRRDPNIQIFVENKIFNDLMWHNSNPLIEHNNSVCCSHYNQNYAEDSIVLYREEFKINVELRASFISNSLDMKQLVEFKSSKVKKYTHYMREFKELLEIHYTE